MCVILLFIYIYYNILYITYFENINGCAMNRQTSQPRPAIICFGEVAYIGEVGPLGSTGQAHLAPPRHGRHSAAHLPCLLLSPKQISLRTVTYTRAHQSPFFSGVIDGHAPKHSSFRGYEKRHTSLFGGGWYLSFGILASFTHL